MNRFASLITAAVVSAPVFRMFAKLSDEDKTKVVDKVKEKVNGKGKKDKKPPKGKKKKDEEVVPDEKVVPGEEVVPDEKETPEEKEVPEEGVVPAGKVLPVKGVPAQKDVPVEDEEPSEEMAAIVDGIAQEIEQIKSDGKVTPGEVMGLMDNMIMMVDSLLKAKPGRARKSPIAAEVVAETREDRITARIVADIVE